ncbi:MAG: HEAT repeat domain-containing protein [Planctomycetota bacterium]
MNSLITTPTLLLCLLFPSALSAARTLPVPQEENADAADPAEFLAALEAALKERKTNDDDLRHEADGKVTEALDHLMLDFAKYDEKQQKQVVGDISSMFKIRTQENEDRIYIGAAACLSEMGPLAEKSLKSAMGIKHLEKRSDVQVALIDALGRHKNEKNIDLFVKLMKSPEDKIVVAAIKSLALYRDSDAKVRKQIAEELIKAYANANNLNAKEKGKNPVFKERFYAVEVPMNEALAAITLQSFQTSAEWEKWYNDNRSKRW